jgi:glycine oxidase
MTSHDAIVVGGGVIGSAVAFCLARAGARVRVLERDAIAAHASSAAAGILAPRAETLGQEPLCGLGIRSLALLRADLPELRERSGLDLGLRLAGVLRVATPQSAPQLEKHAPALVAQGAAWLDPDELRAREPRLAPQLSGGLWFAGEGCIDARSLTLAYARAAEQAGARFELGVSVQGCVVEGGRLAALRTTAGLLSTRQAVLCAGAWSGAGLTDPPLPVAPVKGQMLELDALPQPPPFVLWGPGAYLVPAGTEPGGVDPGAQTVRIGATEEDAGHDERVTGAGLLALLEAVRALLPSLAERPFRRAWAGLRPATPDGLPLIGPLPGAEGLSVASGHYRYGILLAALTGRVVADAICGGRWDPALAACAPARFSERTRS